MEIKKKEMSAASHCKSDVRRITYFIFSYTPWSCFNI